MSDFDDLSELVQTLPGGRSYGQSMSSEGYRLLPNVTQNLDEYWVLSEKSQHFVEIKNSVLVHSCLRNLYGVQLQCPYIGTGTDVGEQHPILWEVGDGSWRNNEASSIL